MIRFIALLSGLLSIATEVRAQAIQGTQKTIEGWSVEAYAAQGGASAYCDLHRRDASGIELHFMFYVEGRLVVIGWEKNSWNWPAGSQPTLQIAVDGGAPYPVAVRGVGQRLVTRLALPAPVFDAMRAGRRMSVSSPDGQSAFSLEGIGPAMAEFSACSKRVGTGGIR